MSDGFGMPNGRPVLKSRAWFGETYVTAKFGQDEPLQNVPWMSAPVMLGPTVGERRTRPVRGLSGS